MENKYWKNGTLTYLPSNKSKIGILGDLFVSTKDYPNAQPIQPLIMDNEGKKTFIHSNSYDFIIKNKMKRNDTTQFRTRSNWASIKGANENVKRKELDTDSKVVCAYHGYNYALGYAEEIW